MRTSALHRLVALLAVAVLVAPLALAADAKIVGTWNVVASTPDGELPAVMTITEEDGVLAVDLDMGGLKRPVNDELLKGDLFTMTVVYDGAPYDVELVLDGDSLEGTYTGSMATGTFTAKRQE